MAKGIDWGIGKPATVVTVFDPAAGKQRELSKEEKEAIFETHKEIHRRFATQREEELLRRDYAALERHRRATMMIDYRAATTTGDVRLYWQRAQRHVAIRVYQHAKQP